MRRLAGFVLLTGMTWALVGCGGAGPKTDKVLATVNGDEITESTFEAEMRSLPPYVRPILETSQGRFEFLENLVRRDLLLRESLRRGLDRKPDVQEKLAMNRRQVLLEALLRDVAEKAPGLSDDELKKNYETNRESFQVGERIRVSHILFADKAQTEGILKRAKAGEPFEDLMKAATAAGGNAADLGLIEKGNFVPEFENAAFAAPQGIPTGPIRTQYGWHVILVSEKRPAGVQTFEEVKDRLVAEHGERAQRDAFETLMNDLKAQARVKMFVQAPPKAALPAPAGPAGEPGEESPAAPGPPAGAPAGQGKASPGASPHGSR